MEFILGGAAASLFTYNRANFMFDKTQQQERLFTGQEMLVKQFELYREDVRDLMELTVAKMDNYLVINVILLTSAVLLMSEGRPEPEMSPEWLHWLYAITNAGAMLYILLSVWLGMHASIAAHSFGVRMLTQYVRLPIPTKEQMDIGRARANQYEEQEVGDMFRIPVLKLQAKRLNAVMNNDTNQEDDESESGDAPTSRREQAATVEHIQRFRELQANWQAYDAYTRVCMAMGTNQLLQATSYYCLTMLICENHTPSRAAVVVVMAMSAWLIIRLDVCISRKLLALAALLLFFGPTAAMACLLLDPQYTDYDVPDVWKSLGDYMVPLVFLTQLAWVGFVVYLAWGKNADGVVLPIKFRAVLYLDVFGRLSQTPESAAQGRARDRLERMASRGSAWQEPSGSPRSPPPGAASDGPEGSWGSARSGDAAAPAARSPPDGPAAERRRAHLQGLAAHCRRRLAAVSDDLGKWEGDAVAACLTEDDTTVLDDVASLRTLLESISGDIQQATPAGTPMDTPLSEGARLENERRQVPCWLRLNWHSGGMPMDFWLNPDNPSDEPPEILWEPPPEPCRVLELEGARVHVAELQGQVQELQELAAQHAQATASAGGGPSAVAAPAAAEPGGAALGASFYPQAVGGSAPRRRKPPGQMPWRTFCQGSFCLMAVWAFGAAWFCGKLLSGSRPQTLAPHAKNSTQWPRRVTVPPKLIFAGPWPHEFFSPKGLACYATPGGLSALVLETYAVHELRPGAARTRPALAECLRSAPGFLEGGLRDVAAGCDEGACWALLLSATGRSALRCDLSGGPGALLELLGGPWLAVAAGRAGQLWALPDGGGKLTRLGYLAGSDRVLAPNGEADDAAGAVKVHASEGVVLGIQEPGRRLHAWRSGGQLLQSWRLPTVADWAGVCAVPGHELLFVGAAVEGGSAGIWSVGDPLQRSETGIPLEV